MGCHYLLRHLLLTGCKAGISPVGLKHLVGPQTCLKAPDPIRQVAITRVQISQGGTRGAEPGSTVPGPCSALAQAIWQEKGLHPKRWQRRGRKANSWHSGSHLTFFFGQVSRLVGSWFPDQGSNLHPLHWPCRVLNHWTARGVSPICLLICFLARPIPRKVGVCLTEPSSKVRSRLIFKWELMFSLLLLPVPEVIWKQVKTPGEGLEILARLGVDSNSPHLPSPALWTPFPTLQRASC